MAPTRAGRMSLDAMHRRFVIDGRSVPMELERALREDVRPGARALLAAIDKRRHERRAEGQRLRHMLEFEQALWVDGIVNIAGVDEAGMSPLAGPVYAGAVVLPRGAARIPDVDDSKKLTAAVRGRLASVIRERAVAWAIGIVEVEEIDRINIYHAGLLAMQRAVEGLAIVPDALLIDARKLRALAIRQQSIVHGDAKSLSIAAASILAKTARDARMNELDARYPGYGFAKHKGYPVREHFEAIERLGPCEIHRKSFGPVQRAVRDPPCPEGTSQ